MTNCSELIIFRIVDAQFQHAASVLVLKEFDGDKHLPVLIGEGELKAILLALEEVKMIRPQTHDLFVNFMNAVHCSLKHVLIYRFFEGIYYARLYFLNDKEEEFFVESRLSDSVAIALRCKVPIYANEEVMNEAGISAEQAQNESSDFPDDRDKESEFYDYEDHELEYLLQVSVENEEFEKASLLRDEINRRKSSEI